jgi:hypothetical protein
MLCSEMKNFHLEILLRPVTTLSVKFKNCWMKKRVVYRLVSSKASIFAERTAVVLFENIRDRDSVNSV